MKTRYIIFIFLFSISSPLFSQVEEEEEEDTELYIQDEEEIEAKKEFVKQYELGSDVTFHVNNTGGTAGAGIKFGIVPNKNIAYGPSIRYHKSWYNEYGVKSDWAVYGGGVYIHYRAYNYFYFTSEFEVLSTPFIQNTAIVSETNMWIPSLMIGTGFSRAFVPWFRLNAGILYDIIDHPNSPFRQAYFLKTENGTLLPFIYRIAFVFTL